MSIRKEPSNSRNCRSEESMIWYLPLLIQINEAEFEAEMIKKKEREEQRLLEVEAEKQKKRYEGKEILKMQMDEKVQK